MKVSSIPKESSDYQSSEHRITIVELKRIQKGGALTIIDFRKSEAYNAVHTTCVLTQVFRYTNIKNYDGSWSE